jgi:copper chaperone CopZ
MPQNNSDNGPVSGGAASPVGMKSSCCDSASGGSASSCCNNSSPSRRANSEDGTDSCCGPRNGPNKCCPSSSTSNNTTKCGGGDSISGGGTNQLHVSADEVDGGADCKVSCRNSSSSETVGGPAPPGRDDCGDDDKNCCQHDGCGSKKTERTTTTSSGKVGGGKASEDDEEEEDYVSRCFALIPGTGSDIVIYDANGAVQSFSCGRVKKNGNVNLRDVCFSSHGNDVGDLLAPCFDEEGLHGDPEEGCFCGIETPHLHAHPFDPETCRRSGTQATADNSSSCAGGGRSRNIEDRRETDLMRLARLTLHPSSSSKAGNLDGLGAIPISTADDTPRMICNSDGYTPVEQRLLQGGGKQPVLRSIKVRHGDHVDDLVHNGESGDWHLEHPCDDCGRVDWHGTFQLVESRRWKSQQERKMIRLDFYQQQAERTTGTMDKMVDDTRCSRDESVLDCCAAGTCSTDESQSRCEQDCHKPLSPKDGNCSSSRGAKDARRSDSCCADGKGISCSSKGDVKKEGCCEKKPMPNIDDSDSLTCCTDESSCTKPCCSTGVCLLGLNGKANASGNMDGGESNGIVRSTFRCSAICCASEVSAINSILNPVEGISRIRVIVPLRNVVVDHDSGIVAAVEIAKILNNNAFGARIERDGGTKHTRNTRGTSRFYVDRICCASEVPAILSIVEPLLGVTGVRVNVTTKTVSDTRHVLPFVNARL